MKFTARLALLLASALAPLPVAWCSMDDYFTTIQQNYNIMPSGLRKAMSDASARIRANNSSQPAQHPSTPQAALPDQTVHDATLALSSFKPDLDERGRALDAFVAALPESLGKRDVLRERIDKLGLKLEEAIPGQRYNLANMTYLLFGASIQNATGQPIETRRAKELIHAIAVGFAGSDAIKKLDDHQRSQIYFSFEASLALQYGLMISQDPKEQAAGRALAKATLAGFGGTK